MKNPVMLCRTITVGHNITGFFSIYFPLIHFSKYNYYKHNGKLDLYIRLRIMLILHVVRHVQAANFFEFGVISPGNCG